MSKPPQQTAQQQTTEPPRYVLPHLMNATGGAQELYMQGPRYVPFSPQTNMALNMQQDRALTGSPLTNAAQNYTTNILQGNSPLNQDFSGGPTGASYLTPFTGQTNPYLDATFDRAAGAVNRNLDTVFARSGRDLDANTGARSDALNQLATQIYGGAYDADRSRALNAASQLSGQTFARGQSGLDRNLQAASTLGSQQLAASGNAIPLSREDYFDISQLGNVGSAVEAQAGNIIDSPYSTLDRYIAQISGMPFGQTTSTPMTKNRMGGALGGAASGAAIGTQIMPGWGTLIGAGAGGLMGYYS